MNIIRGGYTDNLESLPMLPPITYQEFKVQNYGLDCAIIRSSRGCPHNCNFCAYHTFYSYCRNYETVANTEHWRCLSPERAVDEIEKQVKYLNSRWVYFYDPSYIHSQSSLKRAASIASLLIDRQLKIKYAITARVDILSEALKNDRKTVEPLVRSGWSAVFLGLESGSTEILDGEQKGITPEQSKFVVKPLHHSGVFVIGSVILGDINDTEESINVLGEFSLRC